MVKKTKVNLAEVLKHNNTVCPECNYSISPAEVIRFDWERQRRWDKVEDMRKTHGRKDS